MNMIESLLDLVAKSNVYLIIRWWELKVLKVIYLLEFMYGYVCESSYWFFLCLSDLYMIYGLLCKFEDLSSAYPKGSGCGSL